MPFIYRLLHVSLLTLLITVCLHPAQAEDNTARFKTAGETVTDSTTGLMWAAQDNRADITLDNGLLYCENFSAGGFTDWRLPTQDELATLYDGSVTSGAYSIVASIKISGCCLWASDKKDARVASFDFDYGHPDWGHPNSTINARVLPVRNTTP